MILRVSLFFLVFVCLPLSSIAETMSVSFSGADIRKAPTATSKVRFTADRYYPLTILENAGEYIMVKDYRNTKGYIHKSLVKPVPAVVVTGEYANVRSGPGTDNNVLFQVMKGETAKILETGSGWVKIKTTTNQSGWIADFLVWGE